MTGYQPVNDGLNGVHLVAIQLNLLVHITHFTIDPHPHVAHLADVLKDSLVLPFAIPDEGSQDHDAAAIRPLQDGVHDLLPGLLVNFAATLMAMRPSDAGVEQTQIVIDLRHRAHG